MHTRTILNTLFLTLILTSYLVAACGAPASTSSLETAAARPEWFNIELTDAQTGETFNMNDFAGKVVLVETMAIWCPNCLVQANEVRKMHKLLDNPDDVISISLDVDVHEDQVALKDYTNQYGFEWRFAIAPLEVARALGNLYSAEYLNPPLSPMLIIDRNGEVHHLKYGKKNAEFLVENIKPYLTQ
ncbi:MAG: TlpA family protein disulfide reductase [Anaerolineales bacterium]|jgi:peroxiredoxin